jgi:delta24-sterol reductase
MYIFANLFYWHRYVKLNYHPVYSLDDAVKVFEEESMKKDENDFVEGLLFSADQAVIMTGNFSATCEPGKVSLMIASNLYQSFKVLD